MQDFEAMTQAVIYEYLASGLLNRLRRRKDETRAKENDNGNHVVERTATRPDSSLIT